MSPVLEFIGAQGDGGGGDNWSYKPVVKIRSTPSFYYKPDALPVAQPTVRALKEKSWIYWMQ